MANYSLWMRRDRIHFLGLPKQTGSRRRNAFLFKIKVVPQWNRGVFVSVTSCIRWVPLSPASFSRGETFPGEKAPFQFSHHTLCISLMHNFSDCFQRLVRFGIFRGSGKFIAASCYLAVFTFSIPGFSWKRETSETETYSRGPLSTRPNSKISFRSVGACTVGIIGSGFWVFITGSGDPRHHRPSAVISEAEFPRQRLQLSGLNWTSSSVRSGHIV